ncbi:elongation factor P [Propionibacterium australiense]|uniref:Elongation factor P n=1 Tax=Propionibacterium australiense TaxID=119981 RepID=A0A8B3FV59_9ACTN|nr:elongation factor P [Propionibacterium australiense]RLP12746.1 elongation factor P [Propionibacterium australiense]
MRRVTGRRPRAASPSPAGRDAAAARRQLCERLPVATTNDIKNGTVLNLDGQLWQVLWFQHHKPGKGNTVVRTKIKNVVNGKVVDRTFPADTKIEMAQVDRRDMQYLYNDASGYVFMDTDTYEQLIIAEDIIGDDKEYLLEGMTVTVATNEGNPLYIDLPASVEVEVTYTEPGLQGDRSTGGSKPATVETGKQVQVPLFIDTGERIKISTSDGSYLGRAQG